MFVSFSFSQTEMTSVQAEAAGPALLPGHAAAAAAVGSGGGGGGGGAGPRRPYPAAAETTPLLGRDADEAETGTDGDGEGRPAVAAVWVLLVFFCLGAASDVRSVRSARVLRLESKRREKEEKKKENENSLSLSLSLSPCVCCGLVSAEERKRNRGRESERNGEWSCTASGRGQLRLLCYPRKCTLTLSWPFLKDQFCPLYPLDYIPIRTAIQRQQASLFAAHHSAYLKPSLHIQISSSLRYHHLFLIAFVTLITPQMNRFFPYSIKSSTTTI